jgi:hypothetical protein
MGGGNGQEQLDLVAALPSMVGEKKGLACGAHMSVDCASPKGKHLLGRLAERGGSACEARQSNASELGLLGRTPGEDSKEKNIFEFQLNLARL